MKPRGGAWTALIAALDTPSDRAAESVIAKLVKLGAGAVPSLMAAARDLEAPRIRKWSLQALGAIGDRRSGPLLVEALDDERMTVRLHAVRGLRRMRYKPAAKALARLLRDPSGGVRVNAVDALAEVGDRSVAVSRALVAALGDAQWYVRQRASAACGALGVAKAAPLLEKLARDPRKAVRVEAAGALAVLRGVSPGRTRRGTRP